jgi:hypothetical protein
MSQEKTKTKTTSARDARLKHIKKLRGAVFVCLVITSFFFACGSYILLDRLEEKLQHQLYDSIASEFQTVTLNSIQDE